MNHSFVVDLIPFGGLETEANMIAWPPDMSVIMNVAGCRDAHVAAMPVEIEPGLIISLASLPSIAVLKIFAWMDRGTEDPKDAIDLVTLLRQYHQAGNQDRVYSEASSALEAVGYDIELAGAWLLGSDAAAMALPATHAALKEHFNDPSMTERLITDMSRAMRGHDNAVESSRTLLTQFVKGFLHTPINKYEHTQSRDLCAIREPLRGRCAGEFRQARASSWRRSQHNPRLGHGSWRRQAHPAVIRAAAMKKGDSLRAALLGRWGVTWSAPDRA